MDNRGSSRNDPIGSASWFIGRSADSRLLQNVRLHRLLLYVEYHLSEPLSLAMAAEIVGLERTYFSRFFRNAIGQTFFEWNQEIRMQRAKTLLRRKDRSITSVALVVGYRDLTTFERAFKRCGRGIGPRAYRYATRDSDGGPVMRGPGRVTTNQQTPTIPTNADIISTNAETTERLVPSIELKKKGTHSG